MEITAFHNKLPSFDKLKKYGFRQNGGIYKYTADILDGQFRMSVMIDENGKADTELFDAASEEIYTLHLVADACGEFVGRVRAEYETVLADIARECFENGARGGTQRREILEYALNKYGDSPEYLWEKYPDYAVLRRTGTRKWYAVLMRGKGGKLGLVSDEAAEILDVHFSADELPMKLDGKSFFPGYHMNKKHWITVLLDGSVPFCEICRLIDMSYELAK